MKFNNLYNLLVESSFSGSYLFPNSKIQQLYDFYTFQLILNYWNPSIDSDSAKDINDLIKFIKKEMYSKLKKELLEVVYFSIACELRHVDDKTYGIVNDKKHPDDVDNINADDYDTYTRYLEALNDAANYIISNLNDLESADENNVQVVMEGIKSIPENIKSQNSDSNLAYIAAEQSFNKQVDFVRFAKDCFEFFKWRYKFGGENWRMICQGWLNLYESDDDHLNERIDQIYQLEHNSGTVFDKIDSYLLGSSYNWIRKGLDNKKEANSIADLIEFCSRDIKNLANKVVLELKKSDPHYSNLTNITIGQNKRIYSGKTRIKTSSSDINIKPLSVVYSMIDDNQQMSNYLKSVKYSEKGYLSRVKQSDDGNWIIDVSGNGGSFYLQTMLFQHHSVNSMAELNNVLFNKLIKIESCNGNFYLSSTNDRIINLLGFPKTIKGNLIINNCVNLSSLIGCPEKIEGCFEFYGCIELTKLDYLPKEVGGHMSCYDCGAEFSEEEIRKLCNVHGKIFTKKPW